MVEKVCGIPPELFHKVANALVAASGPEENSGSLLSVAGCGNQRVRDFVKKLRWNAQTFSTISGV